MFEMRMLFHVIDYAKTLPDLEQIHLWVLNPETSVAKKLYENIGFVTHGVVKKDLKIDGEYVDGGYMVLELR